MEFFLLDDCPTQMANSKSLKSFLLPKKSRHPEIMARNCPYFMPDMTVFKSWTQWRLPKCCLALSLVVLLHVKCVRKGPIVGAKGPQRIGWKKTVVSSLTTIRCDSMYFGGRARVCGKRSIKTKKSGAQQQMFGGEAHKSRGPLRGFWGSLRGSWGPRFPLCSSLGLPPRRSCLHDFSVLYLSIKCLVMQILCPLGAPA